LRTKWVAQRRQRVKSIPRFLTGSGPGAWPRIAQMMFALPAMKVTNPADAGSFPPARTRQ
jgi:hypothetical protein